MGTNEGLKNALVLGFLALGVILLLCVVFWPRHRRLRQLLGPLGLSVPWLTFHTVELDSHRDDLIPSLEGGFRRLAAEMNLNSQPQAHEWLMKAPYKYASGTEALFAMRATLKTEGGRTLLTIRRTPALWYIPLFIPGVIKDPGTFLIPTLVVLLLIQLVDIPGSVGFTVLSLKENGLLADSTPSAAATAK